MGKTLYSGLSLIFAILRNFIVADAQGGCTWILLRPSGKYFFIQSVKNQSLQDLFLGRKTTKIVHVLQKGPKVKQIPKKGLLFYSLFKTLKLSHLLFSANMLSLRVIQTIQYQSLVGDFQLRTNSILYTQGVVEGEYCKHTRSKGQLSPRCTPYFL